MFNIGHAHPRTNLVNQTFSWRKTSPYKFVWGCLSSRKGMVNVHEKPAELLTSLDPRLSVYESCRAPLLPHPQTSLSHFHQETYSASTSPTSTSTLQMPRGRYFPSRIMPDFSSALDTAAKSRSLRNAGVYSVYYGTIPPFRAESLNKWMQTVRLS